jgi:alpha-galactosidase/6-phospho-beta-glucosidase family protein
MPFVNNQQRRACYALNDFSRWNCPAWDHENHETQEHKKAKRMKKKKGQKKRKGGEVSNQSACNLCNKLWHIPRTRNSIYSPQFMLANTITNQNLPKIKLACDQCLTHYKALCQRATEQAATVYGNNPAGKQYVASFCNTPAKNQTFVDAGMLDKYIAARNQFILNRKRAAEQQQRQIQQQQQLAQYKAQVNQAVQSKNEAALISLLPSVPQNKLGGGFFPPFRFRYFY